MFFPNILFSDSLIELHRFLSIGLHALALCLENEREPTIQCRNVFIPSLRCDLVSGVQAGLTTGHAEVYPVRTLNKCAACLG